ncbi:MAG: hypothetical protein MUC50_03940 [Myxococcota bacterium]|nr:hypothetical protein [Myxococcota bacterium]
MALIENLEHENWQEFLRRAFETTLDVLGRDRFGRVGSSVDDLRSWLTCGGMGNVVSRLRSQMEMARFSAQKQKAVIDFVEHLARENRRRLLSLMALGIVPAVQEEWLTPQSLRE